MSAQVYPSWEAVKAFRPDRFNPVVSAESERTRVILLALSPGSSSRFTGPVWISPWSCWMGKAGW